MKAAVILFFVVQPWLLKAQSVNAGGQEVIGYNLPNKQGRIDTSKMLNENYLQRLIAQADNTFSFNQLLYIIECCADDFSCSLNISAGLTDWLRENHSIYKGKGSIGVNQFRGFLIYSLKKFIPTPALLKYIKSELTYSDRQYNLTAAAATSANFSSNAEELIPLLKPLLDNSRYEEVDITSFELNYPPVVATNLRNEIIKTLQQFSDNAKPDTGLLYQLEKYKIDSVSYAAFDKSGNGAKRASCCAINTNASKKISGSEKAGLISSGKRVQFKSPVEFIDQDGNSVKFKNLKGKPFVLTFFYTSCTNPLKCAATIARLAELQKLNDINKANNKAGVYAVTYDSFFDKPDIIKKYGEAYGIKFSKNAKLFTASDNENVSNFFNKLDIKVNYGNGTVNQHGIQLFVFDKKNRIAKIYDNDIWTAETVSRQILRLIRE
jgi:cytochrome oxidase Cu insertion factor (SCO1/SenC/PrrC family)